MDHLFTYKEDPELIAYFCAAFLIQSKGQLMQIDNIDDLHLFMSRTSTLNFKKIM